jgi:hypothetical protein
VEPGGDVVITRADVDDLRPGDVVELHRNGWPDGTVVRGPLYAVGGWLYVAEHSVMSLIGSGVSLGASYSLLVVSRAPRPLYVNHDRTEPVSGDVVRDADSDVDTDRRVWLCDPAGDWWTAHEDTVRVAGSPTFGIEFPKRLWLLVDGETGQVVP